MKRTFLTIAGACLAVMGATAAVASAAPTSARAKQIMTFTEAAAAWREVETEAASLDRAIRAGDLDEVHDIAFAIRDAVVTLPYKSGGLSAANRGKLERHVRAVAEIAALLDRYGDANKPKETRAQQARLTRTLAAIKALYPAGALPSGTAAAPATAKERTLFLTPGGLYTQADIRANGGRTVGQKYPDFLGSHDAKPKPGDRICPVSETKADPKLTWIVGGKTYQFCCPPCVAEFVRKAKTAPDSIKEPEDYVKQ